MGETSGSGDLDEVWRVLTATMKSFESHRHEGVEDAARRLEILETWRAAYTLRTADKLEELEENTFQTDQAMRLCRLLRRDLTGVLERVAKLEKAPVPTQVPGQYKEAIFMMQGHHFNGPLVCASCKRSLDSSYCGGTWQVDRCVCAEGA
jgi:predicted TPR repeat methyltransferase